MEVGFGAWPCNRNEVAPTVIVEGHMQGLMDVANPMPKAFKQPKLIANQFRSTLPHGERLQQDAQNLFGVAVSIHAPARGAT